MPAPLSLILSMSAVPSRRTLLSFSPDHKTVGANHIQHLYFTLFFMPFQYFFIEMREKHPALFCRKRQEQPCSCE